MYIIMQINGKKNEEGFLRSGGGGIPSLGLTPSFLAASPLVVRQSLHSQIARALLFQRKIKDCSQSSDHGDVRAFVYSRISAFKAVFRAALTTIDQFHFVGSLAFESD